MLRRSFLGNALVATAGFGLLRGVPPAWSQAGRPPSAVGPGISVPEMAIPSGKLAYGVVRGGSDIGRHVTDISRDGDVITVASETSIAVRILMITAYRFEQRAREVWRGGRLIEFAATTNDDGTKNQLEGKASGNTLLLTVDGKTEPLPATIMPASLWNPRLVQQSRLFDTADGRKLDINVQLIGEESLTIRGATVPARHFAFTGDMQREIWYDPNWTPVQVRFLAKDKSEIKFALA